MLGMLLCCAHATHASKLHWLSHLPRRAYSKQSMSSTAVAWIEHLWTRLRRLDYWNPAHTITMPPASKYRRFAPGSGPKPIIPHKGEENVFNIRYFPRDYKRRDVGYYPDTPLSLNHNLMKGKSQRPDNEPGAHLPKVGAFGGKKYGSFDAMGVKVSKGLDF